MSSGDAPATMSRSDVVAALRATWKEGEAIAAGWMNDKERALEGGGMRDAVEKIAARLGVEDAELWRQSMTADEVRRAAGLIPFADYERATRNANALRHPMCLDRGTGRTSRMLCDAIAAASEGKTVHVVAAKGGHYRRTTLERQALGLARRAGVALDRVRVLSHEEASNLWRLAGGDLVLHDHE
ncbi:hypothetical protein [Sorangium sp. So ce1151]|uniref:hypothetical protein n=1 Tax=Sorangium sp. So ce1151 TaxID=3133332 RepID=UPI003F647323